MIDAYALTVLLFVQESSRLESSVKNHIALISEKICDTSFWLKYCSHTALYLFIVNLFSLGTGLTLRCSRNDVQKNVSHFQGQGAGHSWGKAASQQGLSSYLSTFRASGVKKREE